MSDRSLLIMAWAVLILHVAMTVLGAVICVVSDSDAMSACWLAIALLSAVFIPMDIKNVYGAVNL